MSWGETGEDWGRLGETGGDRGKLGETKGTAWALLSNLQLVPGRDNIGDVGLWTFKQVLLNKQQLNIIKFTNFRPKMAAFSLKTFRLFLLHDMLYF